MQTLPNGIEKQFYPRKHVRLDVRNKKISISLFYYVFIKPINSMVRRNRDLYVNEAKSLLASYVPIHSIT